MEIRNTSHLPIFTSLLVHAMLVWLVAHQVTLPEIKPKPKTKVRVVQKTPPTPPEIAKMKPMKPVKSVQKKSAVQPQQVTPQKQVHMRIQPVQAKTLQTASNPLIRSKPRLLRQKLVPKRVQNILPPATHPKQAHQNIVNNQFTPTLSPVQTRSHPNLEPKTTATPIRHTLSISNFKAQAIPLNIPRSSQSVTAVTRSASLKAPVSLPGLQASQNIQPRASVVSNSLGDHEAALIQTASLAPSVSNNLKPVKLEPQGPPGPDLQKALDQFNNAIWAKILKEKFYPKMARIRKLEGQPVVKFTIKKDGTVGQITINNSSSHEILDQAALRTIQRAAPFPEIPAVLKEEQMVLEVPISFILNN